MLLLAIVIPLLTTVVRLAISRTREFQADATGAKITNNPQALANALEKLDNWSKKIPLEANEAVAHLYIVEPMHGKSMSFLNGKSAMKLFSTHPPVSERVERLRNMRIGW